MTVSSRIEAEEDVVSDSNIISWGWGIIRINEVYRSNWGEDLDLCDLRESKEEFERKLGRICDRSKVKIELEDL